jgi:hypothetical protein
LRNFSTLANLCQPKIELSVDLIIMLGFSIKSENVETNRGKKKEKSKKREIQPLKTEKKQTQKNLNLSFSF